MINRKLSTPNRCIADEKISTIEKLRITSLISANNYSERLKYAPIEDWDTELFSEVIEYKEFWCVLADQPATIYHLKNINPIDEDIIKSRVVAWIQGRKIPEEHDSFSGYYYDVIDRIDNDTVYNYLANEL